MQHLFALTALAALVALAAPPQSSFLRNGVTAHRGNSGECPENTIRAFQSAIDVGADWIELDVYLTKDRQLAVTHDSDTGRVGDKKLSVTNSTYAELLSVDVATHFRSLKGLTVTECPPARIPLLADVLRLVIKQERTRLSIQPKNECVQDAFRVIRELGAERWVGFNDGSLNKLRQVKTQSRQTPVFWDRNPNTDVAKDIQIAREEGFECLVIHQHALTQKAADAVLKAKLGLGVWTVNSETEMKSFLAMGVERVYTDYPARLLRLRQSQQPK